MHGEPTSLGTRLTTLAITALADRGFDEGRGRTALSRPRTNLSRCGKRSTWNERSLARRSWRDQCRLPCLSNSRSPNFPEPILRSLDEFVVDVRLVPLRQIDPRLPTLADRRLLITLHQLGWNGLVTNNYRMLKNPIELAAILKSRVTVSTIEGVGDDPIRATGALLLDLPGALRRLDPTRAQVFWMRPRNPLPEDPWALLERVADHQRREAADLYEEVKVSDEELSRTVLP